VHEELSFFVSADRFEHIGTYDDDDGGQTRVIELFTAAGLPTASLTVTEGALMIVPVSDVAALAGKLTPSAAAALEYYFA
jgi:hypothetical protein